MNNILKLTRPKQPHIPIGTKLYYKNDIFIYVTTSEVRIENIQKPCHVRVDCKSISKINAASGLNGFLNLYSMSLEPGGPTLLQLYPEYFE